MPPVRQLLRRVPPRATSASPLLRAFELRGRRRTQGSSALLPSRAAARILRSWNRASPGAAGGAWLLGGHLTSSRSSSRRSGRRSRSRHAASRCRRSSRRGRPGSPSIGRLSASGIDSARVVATWSPPSPKRSRSVRSASPFSTSSKPGSVGWVRSPVERMPRSIRSSKREVVEREATEDVVDEARGEPQVGVVSDPRRLEAHVRVLADKGRRAARRAAGRG